jgi:hypothetical protein
MMMCNVSSAMAAPSGGRPQLLGGVGWVGVASPTSSTPSMGSSMGMAMSGNARKIKLITAPHSVSSYAVLLYCQANLIEFDVCPPLH